MILNTFEEYISFSLSEYYHFYCETTKCLFGSDSFLIFPLSSLDFMDEYYYVGVEDYLFRAKLSFLYCLSCYSIHQTIFSGQPHNYYLSSSNSMDFQSFFNSLGAINSVVGNYSSYFSKQIYNDPSIILSGVAFLPFLYFDILGLR